MAKTVDITKYFNRENEENGIWKELVINGEETGIEACVYGINSNRVYIANEKFKRDEAELEKISDSEERHMKEEAVYAERISSFVKDFRNKETKQSLGKEGKPMTRDEIYNVIFNSLPIATAVMKIATDSEYFLGIQKNA